MADFEIQTSSRPLEEVETPLLAVPVFVQADGLAPALESLDARLDGAIRRVLDRGDFRGRKGDLTTLYPSPTGAVAAERIVLVGCGERADFTAEGLRRAVGSAVREAERLRVARLAVALEPTSRAPGTDARGAARVAAEAAGIAAWGFDSFRSFASDDERPVRVTSVTLVGDGSMAVDDLDAGAREGVVYADATNLARRLATLPGNHATPGYLAGVAAEIAERRGLQITVFDRDQMETEGLHALLAVARGTQEPPRFIVLEYRGGDADQPPLALVGKGVTFDSGGISIKPADRMEEMKYDMSGAAAVLAAMDAIAALGLPVNVVGIAPCTENLPSGTALKPGDVISSHRGKSIEVINTDAEGRLILADALSYALRFKPAAIVDAATLTGAVVIGLGNHAIGLLGTDDSLVSELKAAGDRVGERCWQLPLWDEYTEQIRSDVADVKNTGGRAGGTITAAAFLREFVDDTPWAHLDIAGTAWRTESIPNYLRKGASGVPARLMIEWVRSRART
ncbi:MAG TPA: leucyl aminopeptidase [Longimicrobiales bacterium]|nr:leucyl aminopeptidase [Longimicrobiales bacterium]